MGGQQYMIDRSHPARGKALVISIATIIAFFSYVAWTNLQWADPQFLFLVTFFTFFASLTGLFMISGLAWRSFKHLPEAKGRVLAICPVFNEDSAIVHEVVWSMINQTHRPDAIYVIDDGSDNPVIPFRHPLVTWIRQENAGKREAQANVLRRFERRDWDFIFTVDSDSVLDRDAISHLLRAMSWMGRKGKLIQAATGMIYTRNWNQNTLTRLTDINIASSCLQFSGVRNWLGIQTPTSGAIAIYRSHMIYANLDDYVTSGTMGDDRRLSFYALLRGQVVRVNEAVVETHLPETAKGIMKQRMRWAKSAFLGAPFVATNFGPKILFFYFYPIIFSIAWPVSVFVLTMIWIRTGVPLLMYGVMFWWIVSVAMTLIYAAYRPSIGVRDRVITGFLGLLYPLFGLLLLRPSAYWALATLKDQGWATRGPSKPKEDQQPDIQPAADSEQPSNVVALRKRDVA